MSVTAEQIDAVLIAPLGALGWPRAKGLSATAAKAGTALLADRLRYLTRDALEQVADEAMALAQARRTTIPAGEILDLANRAFPDPEVERQRNASFARWMRSQPGREAVAGDYAVEMLAALRRVGPNFRYARHYATRWRTEAEDRWRRRARAVEQDDTATVARIDALVAEAATLSTAREAR